MQDVPANTDPAEVFVSGTPGLPLPSRLLLAFGALEGAAGVMLAALAAHAIQSGALASASIMLILHAGVVVALALAAAQFDGRLRRLLVVSASIMAAGAGLFAMAVTAAVQGHGSGAVSLAPFGGMLMIVGWFSLLLPVFIGGRSSSTIGR